MNLHEKNCFSVLPIALVIAESGRGCERGRQEPEGPCRGAHVQEGAAIEDLAQEGRAAADHQGAEAAERGHR